MEEQGPLDGDDAQEITQTMATLASSSRTTQVERVSTPPTHSPLRARTPAPSETSTEALDEPTDEGAEPEQINVYSPEVEALAAQAESLHIPPNKPMMTQTQTQTRIREDPPYLRINPVTGHVMDVDPQDAPAVYRAMGSDHTDPPDTPPQIPRWQFDVPDRNPGGPPPRGGGGGQIPRAPRPPPGGGGGRGAFPLPGHAPP